MEYKNQIVFLDMHLVSCYGSTYVLKPLDANHFLIFIPEKDLKILSITLNTFWNDNQKQIIVLDHELASALICSFMWPVALLCEVDNVVEVLTLRKKHCCNICTIC